MHVPIFLRYVPVQSVTSVRVPSTAICLFLLLYPRRPPLFDGISICLFALRLSPATRIPVPPVIREQRSAVCYRSRTYRCLHPRESRHLRQSILMEHAAFDNCSKCSHRRNLCKFTVEFRKSNCSDVVNFLRRMFAQYSLILRRTKSGCHFEQLASICKSSNTDKILVPQRLPLSFQRVDCTAEDSVCAAMRNCRFTQIIAVF